MQSLKNILHRLPGSLQLLFLIGSLSTGFAIGLASAPPVSAACPAGQIETSFNLLGTGKCVSRGNATNLQSNPIFGLLIAGIKFMTAGVGIAVAGGITWGGILYGTARGNSSQTQKGILVIVNSVIGLLLYLFMFAILNFVIPGGIFS